MSAPGVELDGEPAFRAAPALGVAPAAARARAVLAGPAVFPAPGERAREREREPALAGVATRDGGAPSRRAARAARAAEVALLPAALLFLWWLAQAQGLVSSRVLPGPAAVARTFWELVWSGELPAHVGVSLWRVARGASIGVGVGLALGLALGFSRAFEAWIGPSFRTLAQIPSIALIPLLMMVLGIDDKLKLFIMAKACVIPLALVTADGIRNLPRAYLEVGAVFRLGRWTALRRIVLPGALPPIFTGVRQGIAQVWVSLVAVEVLASAEGLGYLMTWGRLIFQLDVVLVCVAVIGVVGLALDLGLRRIEARLMRWRGGEA